MLGFDVYVPVFAALSATEAEVKSYTTDDGQGAKEFFEQYGFGGVREVLEPAECEKPSFTCVLLCIAMPFTSCRSHHPSNEVQLLCPKSGHLWRSALQAQRPEGLLKLRFLSLLYQCTVYQKPMTA